MGCLEEDVELIAGGDGEILGAFLGHDGCQDLAVADIELNFAVGIAVECHADESLSGVRAFKGE